MTTDFLGPNSGAGGPDIKRLLLAVLLMTGVLMTYNLFFAPQMPEKQSELASKEEKSPQDTENKAEVIKALDESLKPSPGIIPTPSSLPLATHEFVVDLNNAVARGGYGFIVSNQGAQISDFRLTGYKSPIELGITHLGTHLFAIASRNGNLALPPDARYELMSLTKDEIALQHMTPQGVRVQRHFKVMQDSFMVEHDIVLKNETQKTHQIALDILMNTHVPSGSKSSGFLSQAEEETGIVWKGNEKRELITVADLEKRKEFSGSANYVGFDSRYFLVALVPNKSSSVEKTSVSLWEEQKGDEKIKGALLTMQEKPIKLLPGETVQLGFSSYLGPKQLTLLKAAGHQLDENINFGWFGVISRPLLWLLVQIFGFVGNFGIAIILLTLLIKLLTYPLTQKSFVSMQQMKKIAPDIKELQKKYSHDRAMLGQKQMELYKEKGINPMAGCLPMLVQMPIWFALYQMLWNSVELYQQPFMLWITDLTAPDPYYVLPIAMGVTMLIQQAFQPTMEDQPQMKYVMWGMPIFLTFIMLKMPAGLSLYIFINNILTIFQQLLIKQQYSNVVSNQISKGTKLHGFKK